MKRKALFVGVNEYRDSAIQDLRFAVGDAAMLFAQFKAIGFEAELMANPTRTDVEEKVASMIDGMEGADDVFLFYFAGHGFVAPGDDERLFCKDDMYRKLQYHSAGLSFAMLRDLTKNGELNRIFILDACRSNVFAGQRGNGRPRDLVPMATMMGAAHAGGAHAIWRSCCSGQSAMELEKCNHGLFSMAIDRVMTEFRKNDAELLFNKPFLERVCEKMSTMARDNHLAAAQTPEDSYSGNWPDVVLIAGRHKETDVSSVPTLATVICPECGMHNEITKTFRCKVCGRDYLCKDHYSKDEKCCTDCAVKVQARRAADERKREEAKSLLEEGKRLERTDPPKAAACFRQAADLGNREACHRYGDMLLDGLGIEKNVAEAFKYYQKCDGSDAWIQYNLGRCHLHFAQERGDAKEGVEAERWLLKSKAHGVPWACVKLGDCYRDGIGVPRQDFAAAESCYRQALEDKGLKTYGDHGAAQWAEYGLGCLSRDGKGVGKDPAEAVKWFRKAAERHSDAADLASTAAAEVLPDVLAERAGDKLEKYRQDFRIIYGVHIRDADGRLVPLAGLVASNRAIFVGVSLDSLPSGMRHSLPPDDPTRPFAQSISQHCGIPLNCFLSALVVPETFGVPDGELPFWAVRESNLADAMLTARAEEVPDWQGKRQDIIRKLETLPMSSEGAEKNALIHFKADVPEWEDGAVLLERVEKPSPQLITLARQAAEELERAGRRSVADNVWAWLEKKGALPKTGDVKTLVLPGGAEMEMIYCAPGEFMMGSPESEEGREDNEVLHRVKLTKGFWLGKYPVTQEQWQSVMGSNPSYFKSDARLPVESISWDDCRNFINKVKSSVRQQLGGEARFPTEAEWEYACRAGTTTAYYWGNALNGDKANCNGEKPYGTDKKGPYLEKTTPVGRYGANAWGFADMHGNVWEWCADWYGDYNGDAVDPTGPASGVFRVSRGGSWNGHARHCRSAFRDRLVPDYRYYCLGFRVALAPSH